MEFAVPLCRGHHREVFCNSGIDVVLCPATPANVKWPWIAQTLPEALCGEAPLDPAPRLRASGNHNT